MASAPLFTKSSPFMHSFLCKGLRKKGETRGEMEWVQAIEMGKREEMMREDELAVFAARGRGTSEGKGRSTEKGNERGDTEG